DTDKNKSRKYYFENLISKEIYLNLQEDEVEFTNLLFRQIYDELIHDLIQDEKLELDEYVNHKNKEIATIVTNILMDDEKYSLSNWERKKVYPKSIESDLPKMVLDAIYNLRRVLIDEKIKSLMENVKEANLNQDTLEMVINYTNLKQKIFEQLHRVV
ncbi:MAG: DNA primase, partial [Lutibacter sp.]